MKEKLRAHPGLYRGLAGLLAVLHGIVAVLVWRHGADVGVWEYVLAGIWAVGLTVLAVFCRALRGGKLAAGLCGYFTVLACAVACFFLGLVFVSAVGWLMLIGLTVSGPLGVLLLAVNGLGRVWVILLLGWLAVLASMTYQTLNRAKAEHGFPDLH